MAIERRSPLPVGRYWIYVLEGELEEFDEWLTDHSPTVHVVASERKTVLPSHAPAVMVTRPDLSIIMNGAGAWVLFDVKAPTEWVGFGFPTIVTDMSIRRSEQIEQFPPPESDSQLGEDILREVKSLVLFAGTAYLGVVLLQKAFKS